MKIKSLKGLIAFISTYFKFVAEGISAREFVLDEFGNEEYDA